MGVLTAVNKAGAAIKHASDNLKDDKDVVFAAVVQDGLAYKYTSDNLKKDKEFHLKILTAKNAVKI